LAYCNLTGIKKKIPEATIAQLTDDVNGAIIDEAKVSEAIAQADKRIDAKLGKVYSVPFSPPIPGIVVEISEDISIYNLFSRRLGEIPETQKDRFRDADRLLDGIADGKVSIGEATEPPGETDQIKFSTSPEDRIFSSGKKSDGSSGSLDNY